MQNDWKQFSLQNQVYVHSKAFTVDGNKKAAVMI